MKAINKELKISYESFKSTLLRLYFSLSTDDQHTDTGIQMKELSK